MDHDSGYKRLFSHPEMMRDLLVGFVKEPWVAEVDFATMEKYPTEFVDDRLRQRRSDVIWRLRWGSEWLYVYVLLEFQSGVHPFMAARLSTYLDLLYQDLIRNRQWVRSRQFRDRRLPPVALVVLYNGLRRWTAATELAELIAPGPTGLEVYRPQLCYVLIDESAYADADLATMRNLVAALFRLEGSRDPETVRDVLVALVAWLAEPAQAELRYSFLVWLREAFFRTRLPGVEFPEVNDLAEVRSMLTERVLDWTQQWKQEGRMEGRMEEAFAILNKLLRRRFGELPAWAVARLGQADAGQLEAWAERIFEVSDLAELLGPERN
jgi:hypothetical protein